MNPILRNVLAVIAGLAAAMFINGGLIQAGHALIPPPEGFDPNQPETFSLLTPANLLAAFFAHAMGSFLGALVAALIAASRKMRFAIAIGVVHMIGGIMMVFMVPSPVWFIILDLSLGYIAMALLAGNIALRFTGKNKSAE